MEHSFGEKLSRGIYALDLEADGLTEILPPGTRLLDISPDRQRILYSDDSELSVFDLGSGSFQVLADDLYLLAPIGAKWDHSDNRIYYLAAGESGPTLWQVNPDNGESEQLAVAGAIAVLKADQGVIIIGKGTCNLFGDCAYSEQEWITDQGERIASYEIGDSIMLPCQKPDEYIYAEIDENGILSLHIQPHDQELETVFWAVQPEYSDCAWVPDGTRLAVTLVDRFWYSGSIQDYYFQILIPEPYQLIDLSYIKAPLDHVAWSPDGSYIAFSGTEQIGEAYQLEINLVQPDGINFFISRFDQYEEFQSENYLTIPWLIWAP
jgi:WD40 repeat protein